jgi:hypothetical protein
MVTLFILFAGLGVGLWRANGNDNILLLFFAPSK